MTQTEDREKLIHELRDLGRLIEPVGNNPVTEEATPQESPPPPDLPAKPDTKTKLAPESPDSDNPETVDMFTVDNSKPSSPTPPPEPNRPPENDFPAVSTAEPRPERVIEPLEAKANDHTIRPESIGARTNDESLEELAAELLAVVEKRLSLHSGESLPESLRDDLASDIKMRLTPWLGDD